MRVELMSCLACPECGGKLALMEDAMDGSPIETGELRCETCGTSFPIVFGIPRFVSTSKYADSFSFEWNRFRTTQLDSVNKRGESEARFRQSFNFQPSELRGKLVLDAGCGMGRFAEVALKYGATVVGVDLSFAIEAAHHNLGWHPQAHFVQSDLFRLPLKPEQFDVIYSLGVLHHTPDPRTALQQLVKFLKPGGKLTVTLYSGYSKAYVIATRFWRRWTTRLPRGVSYFLAHAAVPLYYVYRLPVVGIVGRALFPISMHPDREWRVLDTFDCYTPLFQSYHTHYEVFQWFNEAGLKEITVLEPGVSFIATKQTHAASVRSGR